jgi:hypothetical protein
MAQVGRYVLWSAVAGLLLGVAACKNISTEPEDTGRFTSPFNYGYIPFSRDS